MTGPPIYLVSACTNGEQFVAAFRRYADKHGLFVPIADPLTSGRRARFAVTLVDGGVMIEGDAEVVSSARTPSVMHGRVGMTLRFLQPDATLAELEKARLAMRPAPPSTQPRPATIPAHPRPVPPPVQGRIDAFNALAECVALGSPELLGPRLPPATVPPPKAGPRFVVPAVPAMPPRNAPSVGVPVVKPGPTSDTLVAPIPAEASPAPAPAPAKEPPLTAPRTSTKQGHGPASGPLDTRGATGQLAAPTIQMAVPPAHLGVPPAAPAELVEETSTRTQVHAGAPRPEPPTIPMKPLSRPSQIEADLAEPTDLSLVPPAPVEPRRTAIGVAIPAAPPVAAQLAVEAEEITHHDTIDTLDTGARSHTPIGVDEPTPIDPWRVALAAASDDGAALGDTSDDDLIEDATPDDDAPADDAAGAPAHNGAASTAAAAAGGATVPSTRVTPPGAMLGTPLPTGDWTIALDPGAPDGWSPPFAPVPTGEIAVSPPSPSSPPRGPQAAFHAVPFAAQRSTPHDELPVVEPKVQIDPTLIEPAFPMPSVFDDPVGLPPTPGMATPPGAFTTSLLSSNDGPAYALDPAYAGLPASGAAVAFQDPRFTSSAAPPARPRRSHAPIVIASAIAAAAIGIAVLAGLASRADVASPPGHHAQAPIESSPSAPPANPSAPSAAASPSSDAPAPGPAPTGAASTSPSSSRPPGASTAGAPAAGAPAAAPATCFAEITSVPSGAEITMDDEVLGTTPHKARLQCGSPAVLVIRKGKLPPITRSIVPTPTGAKLKVVLTRPKKLER